MLFWKVIMSGRHTGPSLASIKVGRLTEQQSWHVCLSKEGEPAAPHLLCVVQTSSTLLAAAQKTYCQRRLIVSSARQSQPSSHWTSGGLRPTKSLKQSSRSGPPLMLPAPQPAHVAACWWPLPAGRGDMSTCCVTSDNLRNMLTCELVAGEEAQELQIDCTQRWTKMHSHGF